MKLLDLFKTIIWAKNGDTTDFSQTNYEAGWAHLGDDTPTVQDFNFVQQMNDKKDQWLFNQLKAVLDQAQIEPTEENINTLRDAILKLAKGYSTPNEINAESVNFIDETGHTHEISKANTTQAGIVQLTNDLNNNREDLGLTAKAGKDLKLLINAITSNLSNYIQNSKKSDAVNSSSSDTVATSNAAKTAYDKGVEGVNLANNANANANNRVSKAGDTINGKLFIEDSANGAHSNAGIAIINKGSGRGTAVHFDGLLLSGKVNKGGLHITDTGDGGAEVAILTTPPGNANTDRRHTAMVINNSGALWAEGYGWLHDYFAKQSDNNNIWAQINAIWPLLNNTYKKNHFRHTYYGQHYGGAEVYCIPMQDGAGLKITTMRVNTTGGEEVFNLPERYDGFTIPVATDIGLGRYSVGIYIKGGNKAVIFSPGNVGLHIIVIGWGNF